MTIEEIKELIQVLRDSGIAELEVQRGDIRVWIKGAHTAEVNVATPTAQAAGNATVISSVGNFSTAVPAHAGAPPEDDRNIVVKSPIVGTYYDAPTPGSSPFVKPGDRVEPKTVLCIIESMKLMNEIEAEIAGVVVAKHLDNGRPVEYGESLFTIQPL